MESAESSKLRNLFIDLGRSEEDDPYYDDVFKCGLPLDVKWEGHPLFMMLPGMWRYIEHLDSKTINAQNVFGDTLLHTLTCTYILPEGVSSVVAAGGDVNIVNYDGMTPLHGLLQSRFYQYHNKREIEIVATFIRSGLDVTKTFEGETYADMAMKSGRCEIWELLQLASHPDHVLTLSPTS
jgi:hypothetical protein